MKKPKIRYKDLSSRLKHIICAASSYNKAALIIGRRQNKDSEFYASVYQVLDSFSIELILKATIQVTTQQCPTNEHDLLNLFNLIPRKHQEEIFEICEETMHVDSRKMLRFLELSANAFKHLRYAYEDPDLDKERPPEWYASVGFFFQIFLEFLSRRYPKVVEEGKDCEGFWQATYDMAFQKDGTTYYVPNIGTRYIFGTGAVDEGLDLIPPWDQAEED